MLREREKEMDYLETHTAPTKLFSILDIRIRLPGIFDFCQKHVRPMSNLGPISSAYIDLTFVRTQAHVPHQHSYCARTIYAQTQAA